MFLACLLAKFVLHMSLDTTKHERLQDHMQTAQLVFVELAAFVLSSVLDVLGEPLVELIVGVKQTRHNEVQEGPQFCISSELADQRWWEG